MMHGLNIFTGHSLLFCLACVIAEQVHSQSVGSTTDSSSAQNTMPQMELVSPSSSAQRQEVMMVTTDDYSFKPGLAATPPPPAPAAAPNFQQQPMQQLLHGGEDHDKVHTPSSSFPITSTGTLVPPSPSSSNPRARTKHDSSVYSGIYIAV
jgi:hypothetical protein